jgi:hypothetical protein
MGSDHGGGHITWPMCPSRLIEMLGHLVHVFWYILETTQLMPKSMVAQELPGTLLKGDHIYEVVVVELTQEFSCVQHRSR